MTTTPRTFAATDTKTLTEGIAYAKSQVTNDNPKGAKILTKVIANAEAELNRRKRA